MEECSPLNGMSTLQNPCQGSGSTVKDGAERASKPSAVNDQREDVSGQSRTAVRLNSRSGDSTRRPAEAEANKSKHGGGRRAWSLTHS